MPLCLCIDTSGIMGEYSEQLREDIETLLNDICGDEFLNNCVELGIYTFASRWNKVRDISLVRDTGSATLSLSFDRRTKHPDLAFCLDECMIDVERRKKDYNVKMINYYKPHIIVLGAAEPLADSAWEEIVNRVGYKQKNGDLSVIPIVIGEDKLEAYKQISEDGLVYKGHISDLKDILKTVKHSMRKLSESSATIYGKLNSMVSSWDKYL